MLGDQPSREFQVEVNGEPVRVDEILQVHVAYFDFSGKAEIVVRVHDPITSYQISPVSYRILSDVEEGGREVGFTLDRPRRPVVYINDLQRLLIWAEGPEVDPPQLGEERTVREPEIEILPEDILFATPGGQVLKLPGARSDVSWEFTHCTGEKGPRIRFLEP